jgi:phage tail protein X
MTDFLRTTTTSGDRWDLLAYRFYGDPLRFAPLLQANPALVTRPVLPDGTEVLIPILEEADPTSPASLPPWRT